MKCMESAIDSDILMENYTDALALVKNSEK